MSGEAELYLRPASPADLARVEEIENRSFSDPWPRGALLAELHMDSLHCPFVAERAGSVEGYLMTWRIIDQLHVLNLAVCPTARRRGTGSRLLQAALAAARSWGLRKVALEVRESNMGARLFYAHHGFAEVGRRSGYYQDTGEDAIIMSWQCG